MTRRRLPWILACISLLATGCFTLDFDGDGVIDAPPPLGYEVDVISCSDGRDNDRDGYVDCLDTDCIMRGHCGEQIPLTPRDELEFTVEQCTDGIDNDGDGQFDCGDRGCSSNLPEICCLLGEFTAEQCSDGLDNDGNGFADCADFSCRALSGGAFEIPGSGGEIIQNPGPCEQETNCTDLIDNDGDGSTDCRDSDCSSRCARTDPGPENTETRCSDGEDNDADGIIDCSDSSCAAFCPGIGPENTLEACSDGFDNDGNGFTDCGDFSCFDNRTDPPTGPAASECAERQENTAERCTDGIDNDGNGYIDCEDFSCSMEPTLMDICVGESTLETCSDGIDNDGNGFADCGDFSCFDTRTDPPTGPGMAYCLERQENTLERCSDGIDNDGNGYIDCNDNSCSRSSDFAIRNECEATLTACRDGRDNDGNGYADCGDRSCSSLTLTTSTGEACGTIDDCNDVDSRPAGTPAQSCLGGQCWIIEMPCSEAAPSQNPNWVSAGICQSGQRIHHLCESDSDCLGGVGACQIVTRNAGEPPIQLESELRGIARANCSDGVDNSGNGFTDCENWICNYEMLTPLRICVVGDLALRGSPNRGMACATDDDCGDLTCQYRVRWAVSDDRKTCTNIPGQACLSDADCDQAGVIGECRHQPICRFNQGRTCTRGAQAGETCLSDADCAGLAGACGDAGPNGSPMVCR